MWTCCKLLLWPLMESSSFGTICCGKYVLYCLLSGIMRIIDHVLYLNISNPINKIKISAWEIFISNFWLSSVDYRYTMQSHKTHFIITTHPFYTWVHISESEKDWTYRCRFHGLFAGDISPRSFPSTYLAFYGYRIPHCMVEAPLEEVNDGYCAILVESHKPQENNKTHSWHSRGWSECFY